MQIRGLETQSYTSASVSTFPVILGRRRLQENASLCDEPGVGSTKDVVLPAIVPVTAASSRKYQVQKAEREQLEVEPEALELEQKHVFPTHFLKPLAT